MPQRHAAPNPPQALDSLHRLAKLKYRADHPIPYMDTLVTTGSESIEATLRRRRILFVEFVAAMEGTRLSKCVMFGEMVGGADCVSSQDKEWMLFFLDDLRAFGINADQCTTAAQDEG